MYAANIDIYNIWCTTHEKGPYVICGQRRPRSACAYAQTDLGLHCLLTEGMDTVVYVDEQRMSRSDCSGAHSHLDIACLQYSDSLPP